MHAAAKSGPRANPHSFWPREHGAYVQLLGPLLGALLFVRPTLWSLALACAACAAFLAHEPLLLLLARRGARAQTQHSSSARLRLVLLAGTSALLMIGAALSLGGSVVLALLVPGTLALATLSFVFAEREQTLLGQLLSAATLASFAVPVLVAAQLSFPRALMFAAGWMLVHAVATITARAYVYRKREGHRGLIKAAAVSAFALGLIAWFHHAGWLPITWLFALLPVAVIALLLAVRALAPRTPKQLGWLLTAANLSAFVALGLSLL